MIPKRYSSEGIILKRQNFSEADRILTVLSKNYGKVSLIAKGVRRPKSRKRGALEIFSHFKFSAARGRSLDVMTEAEPIEAFERIRESLVKTSLAYYMTEVINLLVEDEEEDKEVFKHMLDSLDSLQKEKRHKSFRKKFVKDTLVLLGFWPKDKKLVNPDKFLEEVTERDLSSKRVGEELFG